MKYNLDPLAENLLLGLVPIGASSKTCGLLRLADNAETLYMELQTALDNRKIFRQIVAHSCAHACKR